MTYARGFHAIRRPPIMLNITPHTDDSGVMKQHSAIEVGDVLKDKGDVVTLENTGMLYEARNLMMRYSISRLRIFRAQGCLETCAQKCEHRDLRVGPHA
jgi:hypothetical protein